MMTRPGEKCKKCEYCGKDLDGNLEIFCSLPYRHPNEDVCWCVCNECRQKFLAEKLSKAQ